MTLPPSQKIPKHSSVPHLARCPVPARRDGVALDKRANVGDPNQSGKGAGSAVVFTEP